MSAGDAPQQDHAYSQEKPSKEDLNNMKRDDLFALLKERGLPCTGRKDSLVNRLHGKWFSEVSNITKETKKNRTYCCVPLCTNNSQSTGIKLHRIPEGESRRHVRRVWLAKLRNVRANLILSAGTRICSAHFQPDEYNSNGQLNPNAIPMIFPSKPREEDPKSRRNPCDVIRSHLAAVEEQQEQVEVDGETDHNDQTSMQNTVTHVDVCIQTSDSLCKTCLCPKPEMVDFACQTVLPDINVQDLYKNDKKTRFFTGFPNYLTFMLMLNTLVKHSAGRLNYWGNTKQAGLREGAQKPGPSRQLDMATEFLMTMIWYRLGLLQEHLSQIFKVSVSSVSRIVTTWSQFIYEHSSSFVYLPSKEEILMNMPHHFINHATCYAVYDCTEFFTEKPSGLEAQAVTWSEYKHHNTIKVLVGVTPDGHVMHISDAWGGRASDRHIVENEDILKETPSGMSIMADKGFEVDDLAPPDVAVLLPPKVPSKGQMSDYHFFKTTDIAEPRIVVEMKMEQAKNYRLLQTTFPISRIPSAQQIIANCFAFTNLLPPLFTPASAAENSVELPVFDGSS